MSVTVLRADEDVPCAGDIDGNGSVNGLDLAALLGSWGASGGAADVNGDGTVNGADLAVLLAEWGWTA